MNNMQLFYLTFLIKIMFKFMASYLSKQTKKTVFLLQLKIPSRSCVSFSLFQVQELLADRISLCHNLWLHQDWTWVFYCLNESQKHLQDSSQNTYFLHIYMLWTYVKIEIYMLSSINKIISGKFPQCTKYINSI